MVKLKKEMRIMVSVKETSGTDLTEHLKQEQSVYLRTGRSNTVRVNGKHHLQDVRAMHIFHKEDGIAPDVEFVLAYRPEDHHIHITLHDVYSVKVEWMGWSKKFDY